MEDALLWKKNPKIIEALESTIDEFTAGDPMNQKCKWVRLSLRNLSQAMADIGHKICPTTVGKLLSMNDYALRANMKSHEPGSNHPDRNIQFEYRGVSI